MAAFEFTALDPRGRQTRGALEGDNPRQIRQQLRERGLTPLKVVEAAAGDKEGGKRRIGRVRGIGAADLSLITRQLATLVQSGMPLEEALLAVSRQTEKPRIRNLVLAVRSKVLEGHSLAAGLADFPRVFPEIYRATVAAGEQSGHLDAVLERLADYTEARQVTRNRVNTALFYPTILVVLALGIVSMLLTYIVPQVVAVFEDMGQQLPLLTRGLIGLSDFLKAWGLALLGALIVALWLFQRALRNEALRIRYHSMLLGVPLLGRLIRGLNAARFARTLSILAASGVPVLEALSIAAEVVTNRPMRRAVREAAVQVREGSSLNRALERSGYFPPMVLHLIASGESSGSLDHMLERAAVHQEREMETRIGLILGLFEPLVILLMGLVVMIIVLAILLPIFDLNSLVQ